MRHHYSPNNRAHHSFVFSRYNKFRQTLVYMYYLNLLKQGNILQLMFSLIIDNFNYSPNNRVYYWHLFNMYDSFK